VRKAAYDGAASSGAPTHMVEEQLAEATKAADKVAHYGLKVQHWRPTLIIDTQGCVVGEPYATEHRNRDGYTTIALRKGKQWEPHLQVVFAFYSTSEQSEWYVALMSASQRNAKLKKGQLWTLSEPMKEAILVSLGLVHPVTATAVFSLFSCRDVPGYDLQFLRPDVLLQCESSEWWFFLLIGMTVGGLYIAIYPAVMFWRMFSVRNRLLYTRLRARWVYLEYIAKLHKWNVEALENLRLELAKRVGYHGLHITREAVRTAASSEEKQAELFRDYIRASDDWTGLTFIHGDWKWKYWYWEVWDVIRKLMMTGFIVLVAQYWPGRDLMVGFLLSVFYWTVQALANPYRFTIMNTVKFWINTVEAMSLLLILLLDGGSGAALDAAAVIADALLWLNLSVLMLIMMVNWTHGKALYLALRREWMHRIRGIPRPAHDPRPAKVLKREFTSLAACFVLLAGKRRRFKAKPRRPVSDGDNKMRPQYRPALPPSASDTVTPLPEQGENVKMVDRLAMLQAAVGGHAAVTVGDVDAFNQPLDYSSSRPPGVEPLRLHGSALEDDLAAVWLSRAVGDLGVGVEVVPEERPPSDEDRKRTRPQYASRNARPVNLKPLTPRMSSLQETAQPTDSPSHDPLSALALSPMNELRLSPSVPRPVTRPRYAQLSHPSPSVSPKNAGVRLPTPPTDTVTITIQDIDDGSDEQVVTKFLQRVASDTSLGDVAVAVEPPMSPISARSPPTMNPRPILELPSHSGTSSRDGGDDVVVQDLDDLDGLAEMDPFGGLDGLEPIDLDRDVEATSQPPLGTSPGLPHGLAGATGVVDTAAPLSPAPPKSPAAPPRPPAGPPPPGQGPSRPRLD